jgi:hypothetical protein
VPEPVSKHAYALHAGVSPSSVSVWIRRHQLTASALRQDGKINAELADAQLRETVAPRSRERLDRVSAMTPDQTRAALLAGLYAELEVAFSRMS